MVADIQFIINLYDSEGFITEEGVWLCFDDTMVKVCEDTSDFTKIEQQVVQISSYIKVVVL